MKTKKNKDYPLIRDQKRFINLIDNCLGQLNEAVEEQYPVYPHKVERDIKELNLVMEKLSDLYKTTFPFDTLYYYFFGSVSEFQINSTEDENVIGIKCDCGEETLLINYIKGLNKNKEIIFDQFELSMYSLFNQNNKHNIWTRIKNVIHYLFTGKRYFDDQILINRDQMIQLSSWINRVLDYNNKED